MYSPVDLPSRWRAAPAKKRRLSAAKPISSRASPIGLPTLRDSICASSSACSSITSASEWSSPARSPGVASSHSGSASFAAWTALSTSSAVQLGTCAIVSPVAGLITSMVAPETESVNAPPIRTWWLSSVVAIRECLLFGAQDPALAGQPLGERDGDDGDCQDDEHDHVDLRELLTEPDLTE